MILKWVRKFEEGEAKAADVVVMLFTIQDTAEKVGILWQAIYHSAAIVGTVLAVKMVKPVTHAEVVIRHVHSVIIRRFSRTKKEKSNA